WRRESGGDAMSEPTPESQGPQAGEPRGAAPARWVETTTLSAGVVVVLVLYLLVNYLGMRHYERFDATGAQIYSLSEKSENILRELDREIDLVVLLNPGSTVYAETDELLDRYVAANPERVSRRDLDQVKDRLEAQQLIERYSIDRDNVIVVASAQDHRVIGEFELASFDFAHSHAGHPPALEEFRGEQVITSAILSLTEVEKQKLVYTTGHGEVPFEPGTQRALRQARELLEKDNFELEEWSPLGSDRVPADADLVVIAGPLTNFLPEELALLSAYLDAGGRLLIFLDPAFASNETRLVDLGMDAWLRGYGVEIRQDIVIDPEASMAFSGPEALFTDRYGQHPIVEGPQKTGTRVLLQLARSVSATDDPPAGVLATELIFTTEGGWGESGLDSLETLEPNSGVDLLGPVPLAVAVTVEAPDGSETAAGRLVIFGDLDLALDGQIMNGANSRLLLNSANWLVERDQLIAIEGRKPRKTRLSASGNELYSLYSIVLLLMPGAAVLAGIWIAMQRRR
ncbi:MAG: GldG family protein, partial [Acidobacteriota bacterium]